MNFLECDIAAFDCSKYDSDILAKSLSRIMSKLKEPDEKNSDFYCGITNDVVARKSSHESQDYDGKKPFKEKSRCVGLGNCFGILQES